MVVGLVFIVIDRDSLAIKVEKGGELVFRPHRLEQPV
jgi:hypothetical protein